MFDFLEYPSESGEYQIKTMIKDDEVLFLLTDVVRVISQETQTLNGQKTSNQAGLLKESVVALDDDERHSEVFVENGKEVQEHFVTETGVYRVVMRANSSGAKKFQKWVLKEVMPSIRRYGVYPPPEQEALPSTDDEVLLQLLDGQTKLAERQAKTSMIVSQFIRNTRARLDLIDEQFGKHSRNFRAQGRKLQSLNDRIVELEGVEDKGNKYFDVSEVLDSRGVDSRELEYVIALCEKVASEGKFEFLPSVNGDRFEQKFPMNVIEVAMGYANLTTSAD
ncbi:BRO-N domain-containing protein [Vibrio agarivorans]|uniref:BRO-N domain-containing protein n=1 Tax=Vibrio agarivorans TaxID=153622 RepID=UPI0025B570A1|nr:BRO family protein [Vibrio agarivorans]MDN3662651.1 BRO family protein [Vibrio agarivorans]